MNDQNTGKQTKERRIGASFFSHIETNKILPLAATLLVVIVFQIINPAFLSYQGLITIAYSMSYFLIAACGLTMVIMMGSFDFSVISVMKLSALLCVLYIDDMGLWVIPFALAVSTSVGFINGILFAKLKVPSFMATLGISIVIDGIALLISKGFLIMMEHQGFRSIAVTFIGGMPAIFYWGIQVMMMTPRRVLCGPPSPPFSAVPPATTLAKRGIIMSAPILTDPPPSCAM